MSTRSAILHAPGASADAWDTLLACRGTYQPVCVAESLRWRPPLHFTLRFTTAEYPVAGRVLPAGAPVQLALAAANHDERIFPDPQRWLPGRDASRTLTFGGRRVCAGSLLAAAEIERLLAAMHRRFAGLEAAEPPTDQGLTFVMPGRLRAVLTPR